MSTHRKGFSLFCSIFLLAFFAAACEPVTSPAEDVPDPGPDVGFDASFVESVTVRPVPPGKAGADDHYLLTIRVRGDVDAGALPDGFSLRGSDAILWDDGRDIDAVAGDRVYSALVPAARIPVDPKTVGVGKQLAPELNCTVYFAQPGEEICGQVCPEKSSIFKTKTLFCFCIEECDFTLG